MSTKEVQTSEPTQTTWIFEDFTLDLKRACLLRDGGEVKLRPKSFETLRYLVEHHGRLVTKAELIQSIWPDSFVTDDSLVQCLRDIRAALGDQQQRYIKTVPRRGYIFDLAVRSLPEASSTVYEQQEGVRIVVEQRGERARLTGRTKLLSLTAVIVTIVSVAGGLYFYRRSANLVWLKESLARVDELSQSKRYFEAYDLATMVLRKQSDEPTIDKLMPTISDDLSVDSQPAGARVYLRRFALDESATPARQAIGTTPINHLRLARGEYILSLEKDGYATFERTISSELNREEHWLGVPPEIQVQTHLIEQGNLPESMVFVPGGNYALVGWGQPTQAEAALDDYFMDKYEVTNRDYKEFIAAGGYLKKQFWRQPFFSDGKEIAWEAAMTEFKDRTGLPGPRNWSAGEFPEGKAEHPVTNITWYEAAAYAEFKGKQLPNVFQWEKAARDGAFSHFVPSVMPWGANVGRGVEKRANLQGTGTVARDALEFGMSPYGCYQMAGNVAEWSLNQHDDGFITLGGSYADPYYIFGDYGKLPGFYTSDTLGFRCARNPYPTSKQGTIAFKSEANVPEYKPSSEASFQTWLTHYRYDQTPLNAQVVETVDTPEWQREKITYSGADEERAIAYLYLPKNAQPPFQLIQYIPGAPAYAGYPPTEGLEFGVYAPHIKLGRAVMVMILKGHLERPLPADYKPAVGTTVLYRERLIKTSIDVRRGLDYVQTRNEIDSTRIAVLGISLSSLGIICSAVDPRYRSVVFVSFGVYKHHINYVAEANPIFFAPHIRPPKLMLNGRYDEDFPVKSAAEPLYRLLREPKRLELFDGGHVPPAEVSVPVIKGWLDVTLGEVRFVAGQGG